MGTVNWMKFAMLDPLKFQVLLDFSIQVLWISFNGRDVPKAFLSVLCCMNPLLEKGNPFSIKVEWYYSFRFLELLLMIFAVYLEDGNLIEVFCLTLSVSNILLGESRPRFFLPDDAQQVYELLLRNRLLCVMFVVSTAICAILLCIIRCNSNFAQYALLNWRILEEWSRMRDTDFAAAPGRLLDELRRDAVKKKELETSANKALQMSIWGKDYKDSSG